MKATELVAKLNKLVEINPDANVYFYAEEDTIELDIRKEISHYRYLKCGDRKEIPSGKNVAKSNDEDLRYTTF